MKTIQNIFLSIGQIVRQMYLLFCETKVTYSEPHLNISSRVQIGKHCPHRFVLSIFE
jgi:hypothetical protein